MVSISDNDDISDTARYPLVKAHGTWNRFLIYYYYYAAFNVPCVGHVSCFSKIQIGLLFWYQLSWVVPEKGPLNVCVCVCVCVSVMRMTNVY